MNSEVISVKNKIHPCGEYGDSQDFKRRRLCLPAEDLSVIVSDCFNIICSHLCGDEALALMLSNRRFHILVVGYFREKMWSPVWEMLAFVKNTLKVNGMDSEVNSINSMQFDSNQNSIPEIDRACLKVMETVVSIVNFSEQNIGKNYSTLETLFLCYIKDDPELIVSKSLQNSIKSLMSIFHLQILEIDCGLLYSRGKFKGYRFFKCCFSETPVSLKLNLASKLLCLGSEVELVHEWNLDYETSRNPHLEFSLLFTKTFDVDYLTLLERTRVVGQYYKEEKSKFRDYERETKMSWEKAFMQGYLKITDITEDEKLRFNELYSLGKKLKIEESVESCLLAFSLARESRSWQSSFNSISEFPQQLMENGFYNEAIDFCFRILSTYKALGSDSEAKSIILQIVEKKIAKGQIGFVYAIWKKLHTFSCRELQGKIFLAIAASSLDLFLDSNDDIESASSTFSALKGCNSVGWMNVFNYLFLNKRCAFESFVSKIGTIEYGPLIKELINHRLFDLLLFLVPYIPQTYEKDRLLRHMIPSLILKGDLSNAKKCYDGIVGEAERKFAATVFLHNLTIAEGMKKYR